MSRLTDKQRNMIADLANKLPTFIVMERFGVARTTVNRLRAAKYGKRRPAPKPWTPSENARLKQLRKKNLSFSQIAKILDKELDRKVTKNSVVSQWLKHNVNPSKGTSKSHGTPRP